MSLIKCPMCERDISPNALACPYCGEPMRGISDIENKVDEVIEDEVDEEEGYKVILLGNIQQKLNVIEKIRELTGLELREIRKLVDSIPINIITCETYEEAQEVCKELRYADAQVFLEVVECGNISQTKARISIQENRQFTNINSTPYSTQNITKPINSIKCPNCNSIKTQKITRTGRAVGIFTAGIFSSNMGKTWKCKHCGYKW